MKLRNFAVMLAAAPVIALGHGAISTAMAHGCHPGVQRDNAGWHFHGAACLRQNTAPPGLYDGPAYRRYYRGPHCTYRCKFVGPVKTCSQVCR